MFIGYFPEDWVWVLWTGVTISMLVAMACSFKREIPRLQTIAIIIVLTVTLPLISKEFDHVFLADLPKLEGGYGTLPKPLFGCPTFDAYRQDLIVGDPTLYESWKVEIESDGCGLGALSTMLISCFWVWAFSTSVSFSAISIIRLARYKTQTSPNHQTSKAIPTQAEYPENTKKWDISTLPERYRADKLDDRSDLDRIYALIENKKDQEFGWDGHKLKCFLLYEKGGLSLESCTLFRMGFNETTHKGYTDVTYRNTVGALHHRYMALKTTEKILEWAAYCADTDLEELVGRFWHLYDNNLIKLSN